MTDSYPTTIGTKIMHPNGVDGYEIVDYLVPGMRPEAHMFKAIGYAPEPKNARRMPYFLEDYLARALKHG